MKYEHIFTTETDDGKKLILELGDDNKLYVNRQAVATEIKLQFLTNIAIIAGGFSTLGLFFNELIKLCK